MTSRAWLLLLPATLFLLLGFVLPIALLAATSLGGVGGGLGLEQYRRFLLDAFYREFLTETLAISLVTTVVCAVQYRVNKNMSNVVQVMLADCTGQRRLVIVPRPCVYARTSVDS